jgi:DMSO/TMAO reductase YedYZ molybdopterin-dependent catalytic subunit
LAHDRCHNRAVGATDADTDFSIQQAVQLATRNHGMPLEALRHPLTPAGLHYLLIHYDIPAVDSDAWQLTVDGVVIRPLTLGLAELRSRAALEVAVTMECAGNGRARLEPAPVSQPWLLEAVGTARWRGVPLRALLEEAGLGSDATEVIFTGIDRGIEGDVEQDYQRSLRLDEAMRADVLLAYEMNGEPLLPQHGFPLRLVVPGWYGMTNVKWLKSVTVSSTEFTGYQQANGYRFRRDEDDAGYPVTRMVPRSLMVPPGIPEFLTRSRIVDAGDHVLEGRAWSGQAPIAWVEVSTDGGDSWHPADVTRDLDGDWAWRGWTYAWHAVPGEHELCCRAADEAGNVQPLEPVWNMGGYSNNAVQRVPVRVRA